MKKILGMTLLVSAIFCGNAFASTAKLCVTDTGLSLIVAMNYEKEQATVLSAREDHVEHWNPLIVSGTMLIAMDGGPVSIVSPEPKWKDWSETNSCYQTALGHRIRIGSKGVKGIYQPMMRLHTQPNVMCDIPRFARPRAQEILCQDI